MKNNLIFLYTIILLVSCQAQDKKLNFGKYYKIGEYGIQVPFNDRPNISPKQENDICKLISYQYAYPKPIDDINYLYGIDVCYIKKDTLSSDKNSKVDFLVNNRKAMYETVHGGHLIKQEKFDYHGEYSIRQKIKVSVPDIGDTYITSLYFLHDGLIIRLYAFSADENDNNRMNDFFDAIKYN